MTISSPSVFLPFYGHLHNFYDRLISQLNDWIREKPPGFYSQKHLPYYFDEFTFRYNQCKKKIIGKVFERLIKNAVQLKSVTYQDIVANNLQI
jgi:hypothetical protein